MNGAAHVYLADSRSLCEVESGKIDLVVTSPPYWHLKDYDHSAQIGFGQTLHEYLKSLYTVWRECFRVDAVGSRLCINVGDQFARASVYGRYKVIPLHAEIIAQCEQIGFDFMGSIIWQKKTTIETTGGAAVMGSYPYPPNGIVEIDYEHILIFKKPGGPKKVAKEVKERSALTKEQWKTYFSGHWTFGGARQIEHEAMFPDELPARLIKMFSFVGDTVLDPFLGSGTTVKVALELGRNAVGYEVNRTFRAVVEAKLGIGQDLFAGESDIKFHERDTPTNVPSVLYEPRITDAEPKADAGRTTRKEELFKVVAVEPDCSIVLENGETVGFLGVQISSLEPVHAYLREYVLNKRVYLKDAERTKDPGGGKRTLAYVYLKNRIFINNHLITSAMGRPDSGIEHRLRDKFMRQMEKNQPGQL